MNQFIMLIFLLQVDFMGRPFITPMGEDPVRYYDSKMLCEQAGVLKREQMMHTAKELLDLQIVDIQIQCVPADQDNTI